MITPGKLIPYGRSVLSVLPYILDTIPDDEKIGLVDLYELCRKATPQIDYFLYAIDTLYVLDRIDVDLVEGKVWNAA